MSDDLHTALNRIEAALGNDDYGRVATHIPPVLSYIRDVHDTARYAAEHGNGVDPHYVLTLATRHLGGQQQ